MSAATLVVTGIRNATAVDLLDMVRRGEHHTNPVSLAVGHACGSLAYGVAPARRNPRSVRWLPITAVTADNGAVTIAAASRTIRITNAWAPLVVRVAIAATPATPAYATLGGVR